MRCGYPSEKRPRMPDRPSLREARLKVSSTFSKVVESRGKASGRPPQRAELSCAHKSAGGGPRGNPRRGFPLFLYASACAPLRWEVFVTLSCDSTPFLWCLPKETVSSRQRKALFYLGGSTIRVSATASVVATHLRPTWGGAWWVSGDCACAPFSWAEVSPPTANSTPFLCSCAKKRGGAPKKRAYGCRHGSMFGPARLSHGLEAPTSQPTASS